MILLLAACVPVISGPPPTPLPKGQVGEVGLVGSTGLTATTRDRSTIRTQDPVGGGTLYLRAELRDGWGISVRSDFGTPYGLSVGTALRYGFVRTNGAYVGAQVDIGLLYGGLSVPAAFKIGGRVWLWTRPGLVVGSISQATLPAGITVEFGKRFAIHGEVQALTPVLAERFVRNQTTGASAGLGFATRF